MMIRKISYTAVSLMIAFTANAQNPRVQKKTYPLQYFRPPLDLAPQASGTFGELRANHFHSGTDYRTNQREGYPVYAAADGYISRARVQIGGGGNALYINHPNGYTSVYMHLQRFNDRITTYVRNKQYTDQRFDVDFPLAPLLVPVKKGDIIAYSGNTGGSAGPHLHFELRDTPTEHTINAQLFGLTIPDKIPPTITGLSIYHFGTGGYDENTPREQLQVIGTNGHYKISPSKVITVNGPTAFGIVSSDRTSVSANQNGIYAIELLLDGSPIYTASFESFSFDNGRAINSHIDYATYILHRRRVQKSFIEPGNHLEIYKKYSNNGIVNLNDDQLHELTYYVSDVMGNTSTLTFQVKRDLAYKIEQKTPNGTILFPYDQDNLFDNEAVKVRIPKGNLYSNLSFKYQQGDQAKNGYSAIHHIHNRMVPVHNGYTLSIKPNNLPIHLQSKALIVSTTGDSQGGLFKEGYVSTTARSFGSFYIAVDTVAPIIRSINLHNNQQLAGLRSLRFKITDNLSGIQSFNGFIDDKWVLMEYDSKTASLWHTLDQDLSKGKHHFKLLVKDWKDNEKVFEAVFFK